MNKHNFKLLVDVILGAEKVIHIYRQEGNPYYLSDVKKFCFENNDEYKTENVDNIDKFC